MVTPSPSLVEMFTPPTMSTIDLCDEDQVDTGKGKLNNGTSDGTVLRREFSSRLLDDRSTSVYLVSKPQRVLVTGSLPFWGSSPGGWDSVSRQDMYLNSSAAKSGVLLPTILEGTPLEFSDLNLELEPREFFGLDSMENEDVVDVSCDGMVPEAMYKLPPIEVPYSNQVECLNDKLIPEAMVGQFRSDEA
jgi:hypothetical protein